MSAFKTLKVNAISYTKMVATIRVPTHVTEEQVADYYREHGANGEFIEVPTDWGWSWEGIEPLPDDPDAEILDGLNQPQ